MSDLNILTVSPLIPGEPCEPCKDKIVLLCLGKYYNVVQNPELLEPQLTGTPAFPGEPCRPGKPGLPSMPGNPWIKKKNHLVNLVVMNICLCLVNLLTLSPFSPFNLPEVSTGVAGPGGP